MDQALSLYPEQEGHGSEHVAYPLMCGEEDEVLMGES